MRPALAYAELVDDLLEVDAHTATETSVDAAASLTEIQASDRLEFRFVILRSLFEAGEHIILEKPAVVERLNLVCAYALADQVRRAAVAEVDLEISGGP